MQARTRPWLLMLALLPLACEQPDPQGELCPAPVAGVAATYTVSLAGFPEIEDNALVDPSGAFDFTGNCTVMQLDFADGELSMMLACEHPSSATASVTITTAAAGLPAGLAVDDGVTLSSYAHYEQGGDLGGGVFRALSNVNIERHVVSDEQGVVFVAVHGEVEGSFGTLVVERQFNCPGWAPCSADGDISGYIRGSAGAGEVEVQIGEVGQLEDAGLAWDVSLFQALLGGCHKDEGGFSVVRRP